MTDPAPLVAARLARLRAAMADIGEEALVLTAAASVRYASGAVPLHGDASVEAAWPFAAVVTRAGVAVLGVEPASVPAGVEVHGMPRDPARAAGLLAALVGRVRRVGVERLPFALAGALAGALPGVALGSAEPTVLRARRVKTDAEIALLRAGLRLSEAALQEVLPAMVPDVREVELTGRFLAAMARRDIVSCHVEPIWCVLPRRAADAPWAFAGGLPYRELPSERPLASGDQVMIDTGMLHAGYLSDVGWTWCCGGSRGARDRELAARWNDIVQAVLAECQPGASAAALHRAAIRAYGMHRPQPWPTPLYLAHGVGLGGVEPPFIGTDLGLAAEESIMLEPGMVLVLEPYVWEEGAGGYRAEQTIAITRTGYERLSVPPP